MPKINKRQCLGSFQKSPLLSIAQSYELAVRKNANKEALGAADLEDDGIPFEIKMAELSSTLFEQMQQSQRLDAIIQDNLALLGYEETK